jgi:hypothetical protein
VNDGNDTHNLTQALPSVGKHAVQDFPSFDAGKQMFNAHPPFGDVGIERLRTCSVLLSKCCATFDGAKQVLMLTSCTCVRFVSQNDMIAQQLAQSWDFSIPNCLVMHRAGMGSADIQNLP